MTPFGERLRKLRAERAITLKQMSEAVGVSAAYLSALEHGRRGRPSWYLVQRIIAFFNIIWDDAEELVELANISHPRVAIDTAGLSPQATALANALAETVRELKPAEIARIAAILEEASTRAKARRVKRPKG
ncbi:MAG: helix-turn-helix transcriptional regulator [Aestuariivirgaceae bacterium]|nr:helix-turn-helix transcriptional regulator [Aestuariivirgaceae bacterium]